MNIGFFLFLIAVFLMLVSSLIITIIIRIRNKRAEKKIREQLSDSEIKSSFKEEINTEKEEYSVDSEQSSQYEKKSAQQLRTDEVISTIKEEGAQQDNYRIIMKLSISVVIMAVGLFIILSNNFGEDEKKWAFGSIGTIVGYWFK